MIRLLELSCKASLRVGRGESQDFFQILSNVFRITADDYASLLSSRTLLVENILPFSIEFGRKYVYICLLMLLL